jgi:hypothetical protein
VVVKLKATAQLDYQVLSATQIPVINTDICVDVTGSKNMLICSCVEAILYK